MVLKIILNVFGFLGGKLVAIITTILPNNQLGTYLGNILEGIFGVTQQALNFTYLLFGESLFIVLPVVTMLLGLKYVALPIVIVFRSFFINSND